MRGNAGRGNAADEGSDLEDEDGDEEADLEGEILECFAPFS